MKFKVVCGFCPEDDREKLLSESVEDLFYLASDMGSDFHNKLNNDDRFYDTSWDYSDEEKGWIYFTGYLKAGYLNVVISFHDTGNTSVAGLDRFTEEEVVKEFSVSSVRDVLKAISKINSAAKKYEDFV